MFAVTLCVCMSHLLLQERKYVYVYVYVCAFTLLIIFQLHVCTVCMYECRVFMYVNVILTEVNYIIMYCMQCRIDRRCTRKSRVRSRFSKTHRKNKSTSYSYDCSETLKQYPVIIPCGGGVCMVDATLCGGHLW